MPKLDLTPHACHWCSRTEQVFLCNCCHRYTCRECKRGETEEGCVHEKFEPIESKTWMLAINSDYQRAVKHFGTDQLEIYGVEQDKHGRLYGIYVRPMQKPETREYGLYIEKKTPMLTYHPGMLHIAAVPVQDATYGLRIENRLQDS